MCGSRNLAGGGGGGGVCLGGGGGGPGPTARKQLWRCWVFLFCFFSPQLILHFYSGLSMVYFKENYNFPRIQRGSDIFQGWGPTFSTGSNSFQGGGGVGG